MGGMLQGQGQGEQARELLQKSLEIIERLAEQEPGRVDYLRHLSVRYDEMGEMLQRQGQGERARVLLQKSLAIAERLAEQEPDSADRQADLVVSLVRTGDRESLMRALEILQRLDREGRVMPDKRRWIAIVEKAIERVDGES